MVGSLIRLVAAVERKEEQEAVTSACQVSLGHLHHLLGDDAEEEGLEGPWLALVISTMVALQARMAALPFWAGLHWGQSWIDSAIRQRH